jgi:hypothetical protein
MSDRKDPHDGWTPETQEQVQPGDPWRDPEAGGELAKALSAHHDALLDDDDCDNHCGPSCASDIARRLSEARQPSPSLDAALRDLMDRSPIDVDGETLDEWCHYCNSMRADHEIGCEWAALRAALDEPTP